MNNQRIETEIGVELPNSFEKYDDTIKQSIINYLKHLDPIERQAYTIGKAHLGSSFNLLKSNGYIDWKKKN